MKKHTPIFISVAVVLLSICCIAGEFNKVLDIGDSAPDFSKIPAVYFDKQTDEIKETTVSLAEIKEKIVVVVFLANHCPYVIANEKRLNTFVDEYRDKTEKEKKEPDVKVVAMCVSLQEEDRLPSIRNYVKKNRSAYVYGYDATQEVGRAYGASNTPQYFVLDKDRKIRYMGALDDAPIPSDTKKPGKHYLRDAVNALLKGEKPPVVETRHPGCGIEYQR